MLSNINLIKKHLTQFFADIGWSTLYKLKIKKEITIHLIEAYVDMKKWEINFNINKNILHLFQELLEKDNFPESYESSSLISKKSKVHKELNDIFSYKYQIELYDFLASVSFHEIGHFRECPIDKKNFAKIVQAVTTALESEGRYNTKTLVYISNLFQDIIVNSILGLDKQNIFFRNGIFTFYYNEIINSENIEISFFYFILMNLNLFQFNIKIREIFEKLINIRMPEEYNDKLKKLLHIFCPYDKILDQIMIGFEITENEKWKIINYLSTLEIWDELAYDFTLEFIDIIEDVPDPEKNPIPLNNFTKKFLKNKIYQKEIHEIIISSKNKFKSKKSSNSKNFPSKSSQSKKSKKINQKKSFQQSQLSYPEKNNINFGHSFLENEDFLDNLYKNHIKDVKIKNIKVKKAHSLVLNWMNRQIMSNHDNLLNFDPMNLYFLPRSEDLLLYKKSVPLIGNESGKIQEKNFPNLAIFYDDSGSMDWNPINCNGKYDALIIMIYSILKWLKQKSFSPFIKYNFTAFSSSTRSSGWLNFFNLDKLKKILFKKEDGGTNLDEEIFNKIISDVKEKVVLMITDGWISNFKEIKKIIIKNKENTNFFLIQIGEMSEFAKQLKNKNIKVKNIHQINNLNQIVLDFLKKTY